MNANEMWQRYISDNNLNEELKNKDFYAWSFADTPDELAELVLKGIKTSSSSSFQLYEVTNIRLSEVGDYHIVLDSNNIAICIIQTTSVKIIPFDKIGEKEAIDEGDGNLENWVKIHERYFKDELNKFNIAFDYKIPLVYEEFKLLYPKNI